MEKQPALYSEKNNYLSTYCEAVTSFEFYRDIFPVGSFERKGIYEDNKPNGIVLEILKEGRTKRATVTDDLAELVDVKRERFTIVSPLSYFGYRRTSGNARFLYALAFDLDGVEMKNLYDLLHQMDGGVIPKATYIVNSGTGLHLYYVLEEPIPLYPKNQKYLKEVKYALTKRIWNGYTSTIEEPQMQGIMQGFRVVGSPTKLGAEYPVVAFLHGKKWDIDELVSYVPDIYGSGLDRIKSLEKQANVSLEEAKKKYPEWYDRRVVRKESKGRWTVKRDLYDWWLGRIRREIQVGHRYYGIMTLAIYAKKCDIDYDELAKDAFSLQDMYDSLSVDDSNRFGEQEIFDALELYNESYVTFPRDDISRLTGLPMTANKRNGRKQKQHLKMARMLRDFKQDEKGTDWGNKDGRPPVAEQIIRDYLTGNQTARKCDVIRETGLSKPTVYKYYDEIKKEIEASSR